MIKYFVFILLSSTLVAVTVAFHIPDISLDIPFLEGNTTTDYGVTLIFQPSSLQENEEAKKVLVLNNVTKETVGGLFDKTKETKIIVHGWHSSCNTSFAQKISKAFRDTKRFNVICIDWSQVSRDSYPVARWDAAYVGGVIGTFLDRLFESGVDPARSHIVGHSLGAHIAGIAGFTAKKRVARITGLDPAGPFFMAFETNRLRTESADFVDVIHTCANYKGMLSPLGHVDFYPNSGRYYQPGCGPDLSGSCSHARSYVYYIESITRPGSFLGIKCPDWKSFVNGSCKGELSEMGENVDRSAKGLYYLHTAKKTPFGLGKESVTPMLVN